MQYGVEVPTYRRVDDEKSKKISFECSYMGLVVTLIMGLMLSRVGVGFIEGLYIAPFGVAYFLAILKKSDINIFSGVHRICYYV